jgi:hypothetical protein
LVHAWLAQPAAEFILRFLAANSLFYSRGRKKCREHLASAIELRQSNFESRISNRKSPLRLRTRCGTLNELREAVKRAQTSPRASIPLESQISNPLPIVIPVTVMYIAVENEIL